MNWKKIFANGGNKKKLTSKIYKQLNIEKKKERKMGTTSK